ncbi:MAG TPA: deoxyribose-phosphate aldolase [Anaeromyxobacter sp.]|nr:deoxyribose-phosphate aldolase [Anaeromyxobacter sp.]
MREVPLINEPKDLAHWIDHTILAPDATEAAVEPLCAEAIEHGFRSVCVNSVHVRFVAGRLRGSPVKTCSVVSFPFGAAPTGAKAAETALAIEDGATEVDMVLAVGLLKGGRLDAVRADIAAVKRACGPALLKVILETCFLTDEEKVTACRLAEEAGADFVKTSTGFGPAGATVADVALMRRTVGPDMGIKAAGGIRTFEKAKAMIEAGATRIGASASLAIIGARR